MKIEAKDILESINIWENYYDTQAVHKFADSLRARINYLVAEMEYQNKGEARMFLSFSCPKCGNSLKLICPNDWPIDAINAYRKCQYCGGTMEIIEQENYNERQDN